MGPNSEVVKRKPNSVMGRLTRKTKMGKGNTSHLIGTVRKTLYSL